MEFMERLTHSAKVRERKRKANFRLLIEPIVLMVLDDDFQTRRAMLMDDSIPKEGRARLVQDTVDGIVAELYEMSERGTFAPRIIRKLARWRTLTPECYVPLVLA